MVVVRQKGICLIQNYQGSIFALLRRHYGVMCTQEVKVKHFLKRPSKQTKLTKHFSGGIVESPLGPCPKIPNQNLVEFVFKDIDQWIDDKATVGELLQQPDKPFMKSFLYFIGCFNTCN